MTYDEEKTYVVGQLRLCMKRIPTKVNEGSVQVVRHFKAWYSRTEKALSNRATNLGKLNGLLNEYGMFL